MKITKSQLKQIIKEEIKNVLVEGNVIKVNFGSSTPTSGEPEGKVIDKYADVFGSPIKAILERFYSTSDENKRDILYGKLEDSIEAELAKTYGRPSDIPRWKNNEFGDFLKAVDEGEELEEVSKMLDKLISEKWLERPAWTRPDSPEGEEQ